ncbi:MAG: hypothetical protein COS68_03105 [Elusimicrobia bacterium CG06_land_8_20_14_3_00_38_11]|nr:MAG: hypothetical protein COS68_03105 [Elusimicrobia bacterium CG06_land_8_20_14_3_00_38_11]
MKNSKLKIKNDAESVIARTKSVAISKTRFLATLGMTLWATSCFLLLASCGKKETKQTTQQVAPRPKPKIPEYVPPPAPPKYTYKGGLYRDPLVPGGGSSSYSSSSMTGEGSETMTGEKMATLQLKGIFRDEKTGNIAIIAETSGGSYILKNGKLYDRKNKIVRGVAGVIGKNSATLFSNDTKIELKLKKIGSVK